MLAASGWLAIGVWAGPAPAQRHRSGKTGRRSSACSVPGLPWRRLSFLRSYIQHQPPTAGARHADHHALAGGAFLRRQDAVAVVDFAGDDPRFAGAADALLAG